jgi:hypothetical protein
MTAHSVLHLSSETVRVMAPGRMLVLNLEEQIVTLLAQTPQAHMLAQSRFPRSAFRALLLLLRCPSGATYAQLLASLHCSEEVLHRLVTTPASDRSAFEALVSHWQTLHWQAAHQGEKGAAVQRELKALRWAVKGKRGLEPIAQRAGFGWRVQALPRRGYLLLPPSGK